MQRSPKTTTQARSASLQPRDKCPLCDTALVLKHSKPSQSRIVEKAHCPQCHVPARDRSFTVH